MILRGGSQTRPDFSQNFYGHGNENAPPGNLIGEERRRGPLSEQEFARRAEALKARLYRTALLYLGSETAAVDAVDEAVYKGFLARKRLRQPEYFSTWLTRILINVCNQELRRRKRETATDVLPETAVEEFDSLPLKEAVERLPQDLRAVIVLRYFTGLTLSETAAALNVPPGTVSTRQRKGLSLLRLELEDKP